jgi:hypothetical protein
MHRLQQRSVILNMFLKQLVFDRIFTIHFIKVTKYVTVRKIADDIINTIFKFFE